MSLQEKREKWHFFNRLECALAGLKKDIGASIL